MRVLIIGLGSIALKHIAAIGRILPKAEFYALRSDQNAQPVKNIRNIFSLEALKDTAIDFAIISNPTAAHAATIKSLLPKRIPLFIEKPLFSQLGNEDVIREIKEQNIQTYVACNLRFLDCLRFVKEYVKDGRINEVNSYCGSYLPDWRPGADFRKTYSANKNMGGGVHIDLIHEIDYIYWLFGRPEKVTKTFSSKSSLNIDAYDYANYTLAYSNFNAAIVLNYYRRDAKRCLEIVLDNETILVNLLENKVYRNDELIFASEKTIAHTYEIQLRFFINEVVLGTKEFNTVAEAYEILQICLQED